LITLSAKQNTFIILLFFELCCERTSDETSDLLEFVDATDLGSEKLLSNYIDGRYRHSFSF
jgi:hypothetical protein